MVESSGRYNYLVCYPFQNSADITNKTPRNAALGLELEHAQLCDLGTVTYLGFKPAFLIHIIKDCLPQIYT